MTDPTAIPGGARAALDGVCVLVTRARHQAASLADPLVALGARVLAAPVVDMAEPDDWGPADRAIAALEEYDWVVLTSANAVERFVDRMGERGRPASDLSRSRVAVVGPATAERLREFGVEPALVPDDYRAEGLRDDLLALGAGPGWRVLVPRALKAREILPDALRAVGVEVDVAPVYRTVPAMPDPAVVEALRRDEVDIVTFTSPSTVRNFLAWVAAAGLDTRAVMRRIAPASIGPVTTEALRRAGFDAAVQAEPYTVAGLVEAIVAHALAG